MKNLLKLQINIAIYLSLTCIYVPTTKSYYMLIPDIKVRMNNF